MRVVGSARRRTDLSLLILSWLTLCLLTLRLLSPHPNILASTSRILCSSPPIPPLLFSHPGPISVRLSIHVRNAKIFVIEWVIAKKANGKMWRCCALRRACWRKEGLMEGNNLAVVTARSETAVFRCKSVRLYDEDVKERWSCPLSTFMMTNFPRLYIRRTGACRVHR